MNEYVLKICEAVRDAGGRAMLVGGCVRDRLLGFESKDFDLEVYHLEPSRLRKILQSLAQVNTVGEHFAVYKLAFYSSNGPQNSAEEYSSADLKCQTQEEKDESATRDSQTDRRPPTTDHRRIRFEIDVSIPRRESKTGRGHRGFVIEGDPHMTFEEAARRRDFTINAIMQDPLTEEILDPFGGTADLDQRMLRAVAADTFVEDSLRVLRAVQFAARFEMSVATQTIELCRLIDLSDLPRERIWGEIEKLLWLANRPSIGLQVALELGALDKLFPQFRSLLDFYLNDSQAPDKKSNESLLKHDAFEYTKYRLDEAAKLTLNLPKEKRLTVMLAALCQNLIASPLGGPEPVIQVMDTLGLHTIAGYDVREQVLSLVREQKRPRQFYEDRKSVTDGDFRRLAQRVDMTLLYLLAKADARARDFASTEAEEWFKEKTRALNLENGPPVAILMGRHLLEAGIEPGPQIGEILRRIYELQLDGAVTSLEEAIAAAKLPA
jgi:tRNA nucleotidyltransferase (CCA-adding enzyme)